eukprot:TRINITY_DN3998_c0_g1_i1.p1 TRINITY_DN3998_c0_g1~~TRINITY_DN3998_c0_g1_i1.p1  ORF type:complete len:438 (-),score=94.72 TRINITY_DN3998_c0_g1_i1:325-1638(-)
METTTAVLTRRKSAPNQVFTLEEVAQHKTKGDSWLIVDREVYDVSDWIFKHPGGKDVVAGWAGQDASAGFAAFHTEGRAAQRARSLLKQFQIGSMTAKYQPPAVEKEFELLRLAAQGEGLFKSSWLFYALHLAHILVLDLLGFWIYREYGASSWVGYLAAAAVLTVAQNQAGWLQHDFGHLSVFDSNTANHWMHHFVTGFLKVASSSWWNYRHFKHHSKPNVVRKDPDVSMGYVFLLGDEVPKKWAAAKRGFMPYHWQHKYWYFVGPPFLLPVYFHADVLQYVLSRNKGTDLLLIAAAAARWLWLTDATIMETLTLYMFVRVIESHWFTWVTQMNHISMKVTYTEQSWVQSQLQSTCNVEQSAFNDWFTGHLNFQIEHHLFPTMPRHNYHKIAPRVKALCQKHGLKYECKTLLGAFSDVVDSLQASGEVWYDAIHPK